MIRVSKSGRQWFGIELHDNELDYQDIDEIKALIEEGDPVLIVSDFEQAKEILGQEVIKVERDE